MPLYGNKDYKRLIRPLPDFTERDIYDIPIIWRHGWRHGDGSFVLILKDKRTVPVSSNCITRP